MSMDETRPEDTRTRSENLRGAAEGLRDAFSDGLSSEQAHRFDILRDGISALEEDERQRAAAELAEAPIAEIESEPEPAVEYDETPAAVTIHLRAPFTFDGTVVGSIELRPPVYRDVLAVTDGDINERELHARMAGLPAAALRALSWSDYEIMTVAARHLAPEMRRG